MRWVMRPGVPRRFRRVDEPLPRAARAPSPAIVRAVVPSAVVIRRPTPGIRRHPGIPRARVPNPRAIGKWIPGRAREVGSPYLAAVRSIDEPSVIPHVGETVGIGRIPIGAAVDPSIVVVGCGLVPVIKCPWSYALDQLGLSRAHQAEGDGFVLANRNRAVRCLDVYVALEDCQVCPLVPDVQADMTRRRQEDFVADKSQRELVARAARQSNVHHALVDSHRRNRGTGRTKFELREFDLRVPRQTQCAVVLELDLGSTCTCSQAGALDHRQVQQCLLKALPGVPVHLYFTLNIAKAHNAYLGVCDSGKGRLRARDGGRLVTAGRRRGGLLRCHGQSRQREPQQHR